MKPKKKMSMYKKGGFNPQPDTSYQSPASKSARAKSKNKRKQINASMRDVIKLDLREFDRIVRASQGNHASKDERFNDIYKKEYAKKRKSALEKGKKLYDKDLSEFKEYKGGGKMPEYMAGGKVYEDGGSLLAALMKDPKQRAAAKKMLGM